jgi:very-short-patch-repair endonuclease
VNVRQEKTTRGVMVKPREIWFKKLLKKHNLTAFRCQWWIAPANTFADFIWRSKKIIVDIGPITQLNSKRDEALKSLGYKVFRIQKAFDKKAAEKVLHEIYESAK